MQSPFHRLQFCGGLVGLLASACPVLAQSSLTSPEPAANWNLTIEAGVRYTPDYLGSNDYSFRPVAAAGFGRGSDNRWWTARDDAMSMGMIQGSNWRLGFSGQFLWERRASSNLALRGLGNVNFGIEAGTFVEYYVEPWLRARIDVRRGFFAHDAVVAELKLDAFTKLSDKLSVGIGPRLTLVTADYNRTYFGVNQVQSRNSGLPVSRPSGGLLSYGALAQATYQWTPRLSTTVYAEYKRLAGDAARAGIVKRYGSADQFTVTLATSWTVDLGF